MTGRRVVPLRPQSPDDPISTVEASIRRSQHALEIAIGWCINAGQFDTARQLQVARQSLWNAATEVDLARSGETE